MDTHDVTVSCDVRCHDDSRYRVWVADELFTERRWRWGQEYYLEEIIVIRAQSGRYHVRYDIVPNDAGQVVVSNYRVVSGPATIDQNGLLEITDANT